MERAQNLRKSVSAIACRQRVRLHAEQDETRQSQLGLGVDGLGRQEYQKRRASGQCGILELLPGPGLEDAPSSQR